MAASRRFQAEMETTDVRQFGDEAVVPDSCTLLRVIRFGFPADLFSFCQIFKVTHYPSSLSKTGICSLGTRPLFSRSLANLPRMVPPMNPVELAPLTRRQRPEKQVVHNLRRAAKPTFAIS